MPELQQCAPLSARRPIPAAFIDADEYLTVLEPAASLRSILADYEHLGGLGVHWRIFGAGGGWGAGLGKGEALKGGGRHSRFKGTLYPTPSDTCLQ